MVKTPSIHESPKHIGTPIPLEATHEVKPDTARTEGLTDIVSATNLTLIINRVGHNQYRAAQLSLAVLPHFFPQDESMDEDNISGAKGEIHQTSSVPSPIRPVTNNTDETYTAGGGKTQRSAEQLALKTSLDRLKRQLATKDKENKVISRLMVDASRLIVDIPVII